MQNIKISVIIPVYNAEKYLRECLDSIVKQTLQEIEIICIDDGSTDNSLAVLREYERKDERLKIIEQANSGAGVARNAGMKAARGEYLAFMDADDVYCSGALNAVYSNAKEFNSDISVFEAIFFDNKSEWQVAQLNQFLLAGRETYSSYDEPDFLFQIAACNPWSKLFRREFVQKIGLQYQELKTANDLCFVCSAMACAEKIAVLNEPLVKHRVLHSGNLQSVKIKTPLDFMAALEQLKSNLQQFGLWDKLKHSYLNCALSHFVYNWQTLDKLGRKQIVAKSREITELLELSKHSPDYYYSLNDYVLMCKVVRFNREGDLTFMGKLKNLLKHILPPPVNAFNREVAGIKQMMQELNFGLLSQQNQEQKRYDEKLTMLVGQQKEHTFALSKQITSLDNKYLGQISVLAETNKQQLELLRQQQVQVAEIEQRQQQILERLGKLDELVKLDCLQTNLAESHKDILNNQAEHFADLQKNIQQQADNTTSLINGIDKDLQQLGFVNDKIKELAWRNVENGKYAVEAVWAAIFNNTIFNSQWLVDKTFAPGRWAVGYPYLYVMYRVLNEVRPKKILELGLGQSTRMIGQYAAACSDVEHIVVEHDLEWIRFFENDFQLSNHSQIVQLEREMIAYKEAAAVRVFSDFKEHFVGQKFDFISIDAPLGGDMKQYARIDVLTMLPECLSDDFVIMFDDCERVGEANTLAEMEKILQENEIKYKCGRYSGKKDCVLICAEHLGFLASM